MTNSTNRLSLTPLGPLTLDLAATLLRERWHDTTIISKGITHRIEDLEGYVAWLEDEIVGLVTFVQTGPSLQMVSMDSFRDGMGTGKALNDSIIQTARVRKCNRVWLVITNDNLEGLSFYQKRGWNICGLHLNTMKAARLIKPSIPEAGENGIRIQHEIELEILL